MYVHRVVALSVLALLLLLPSCAGDDPSSDPADQAAVTSPADADGAEEDATKLTQDELAALDLKAGFLTVDEVGSVIPDVPTLAVDPQDKNFDLAGTTAVAICGYKPAKTSTAEVGVGTEYIDEGPSISITQRVAGFDVETADVVWADMTTRANLEGDCKNFTLDGQKMDVGSTPLLRDIWTGTAGERIDEADDVLLVEHETPSGLKICDILVRSGQVLGEIRVVYKRTFSGDVVKLGLAFQQHLQETFA